MAGKSFDLQGGMVLIDPDTGQSYSGSGVPTELKARINENPLGADPWGPEDYEFGALFVNADGRLEVAAHVPTIQQEANQDSQSPIAALSDFVYYSTLSSQGCNTAVVGLQPNTGSFKGTITFTANSGCLGGIPIAGTRLDTGALEKSATLDLSNALVGWRFDTRGIDGIQVICTAYTSGSAKVYINSGR